MTFLPPQVSRALAQRSRSFRADVLASVVLEDSDGLLVEINRQLRARDPRLLLVRAREAVVLGVPMKPGYYHLLRDNSDFGAPMSVTVIEGEHGEFVEPTSRVHQILDAGDLHERRNRERYALLERAEHDRVEREKQRDRAERREHLRDLVDAYTRTTVSMTDVQPWTQNMQPNARRARTAARIRKRGER